MSVSPPLTATSPRGRLRIFLGYAPGVGKTFAMLETAQRRRREGVDIVLAELEHHGREHDALLEGLERIPPRPGSRNDLDLDTLLARRPAIVAVARLAHRNQLGARHPRRYQDIDELLNAGIDVFTTLNVYQIESLKDVVKEITGLIVAETVPDRMLDQAAQIELIDTLPEEVLQRYQAGKVASTTAVARDSVARDSVARDSVPLDADFYRRGNLTALRELSLRQLARRVDDEMVDYMQTRRIAGPWPAADRLLVCVSPSPLSPSLVRTACRLAQELDVPWHAVYVESGQQATRHPEDQARLNETLRLAESLGARVAVITGQSVADTLLDFARRNNITQILVGQPLRARWQTLLRGSMVNRLIEQGGQIDVHVISARETEPTAAAPPSRVQRFRPDSYLKALLVLLLATLAAGAVNQVVRLDPTNLVMFYLLAVVIVAVWLGYGAAVMTAVVSVIAFNFFFVPPQYTFQVEQAEYLLTFLGLLGAGLVTAELTSRARRQTQAAQQRERETAQLYSLSRDLSATVEPAVIVRTILDHVTQAFHADACMLLLKEGALQVVATTAGFRLTDDEQAAADWAATHGQPAGQGTDTLGSAHGRYVPLRTAQRTLGVLGVVLEEPVTLDQERQMDAFAAQAALAIEATQLGDEARQAQILREKEKLQSAVLNAISHDLRTPLVSITGALSSLRETAAVLAVEDQQELLDGAILEADRMNRLVGNLLDMSRLEAGGLRLRREPYDLQEVIAVARAQLKTRLSGRELRIDLPDDLPLVNLDLILFAQVLVNLLENALKYSVEETPVEIRVWQESSEMVLEVADRGIGIPEADLPHIFEKFYRAQTAGGHQGSGLGLSICQGIVEAHGGTIAARNRPGGGTCFIIRLPLN